MTKKQSAFIKKSGKTFTEEAVQDYCRGKIIRFKIPAHIFSVDDFPKTASGKIKKHKLREQGIKILKNKI